MHALKRSGVYLFFRKLRNIIIFPMQLYGAAKLLLHYFFCKNTTKKKIKIIPNKTRQHQITLNNFQITKKHFQVTSNFSNKCRLFRECLLNFWSFSQGLKRCKYFKDTRSLFKFLRYSRLVLPVFDHIGKTRANTEGEKEKDFQNFLLKKGDLLLPVFI